jgi:plasmid stabilization system protein ParE
MNRLPRVDYTREARREFDLCRQLLRRHSPDQAWDRTREIVGAVRRIRANPEMHPVRTIDPLTGLALRRCNVAQFAIVYVYFGPSPTVPFGLVSLRAFRHARREDVLWRVRENAPESDAMALPLALQT